MPNIIDATFTRLNPKTKIEYPFIDTLKKFLYQEDIEENITPSDKTEYPQKIGFLIIEKRKYMIFPKILFFSPPSSDGYVLNKFTRKLPLVSLVHKRLTNS
jgi:hypothetical protein